MEKEEELNETQDQIKFYRRNQPHGFLSNFYKSPFKVGKYVYQTVQHYFQSKKFEGKQLQEIIIMTETPHEVFRLGQNREIPIKPNWDEIKEIVMYEALKQKFIQNEDLRAKLIQTGERKLIEHTQNDKYWADGGGKGKGKNRLGILLMKLRDELRK